MNQKTMIVIIAAIIIRVLLIDNMTNLGIGYSNDLQNYMVIGLTAEEGQNPYQIWNSFDKKWIADWPPLETLMLEVIAWISKQLIIFQHIQPQLIGLYLIKYMYYAWIMFDVLNIWMIYLIFRESKFGNAFQLFYAFNPLTIFGNLINGHDKLAVFFFVLCIIYLMISSNFKSHSKIIGAVSFLISFKWIGFPMLIPIIHRYGHTLNLKLKYASLFLIIFISTNLMWFPYSINAYFLRAGPDKIASASHASLLLILPVKLYLPLLLSSIILIYILYYYRYLNIIETVVFSVVVSLIWGTYLSITHIVLICVSLMTITKWCKTTFRTIVTWALGVFIGFSTIAYNGFFAENHQIISKVLVNVYGAYASTQYVILSQALIVYLLVLFIYDNISSETMIMIKLWIVRIAGRILRI